MIKKKEQKKGGKFTPREKESRYQLHRYHQIKREAWKEFMKTPEGIEVIKKRKRAGNIAKRRLKKFGLSIKDLNPFKYFHSK